MIAIEKVQKMCFVDLVVEGETNLLQNEDLHELKMSKMYKV